MTPIKNSHINLFNSIISSAISTLIDSPQLENRQNFLALHHLTFISKHFSKIDYIFDTKANLHFITAGVI